MGVIYHIYVRFKYKLKFLSNMKKITLFIVLMLFTIMLIPTNNSQSTGQWDGTAAGLAQRTAPFLYLHPKESFYPVSPEYAISRSNLNRSEEGLITASPSGTSLAAYTDPDGGYYLDNRMGTIHDDGIEKDFLASRGQYPPTVYARVSNIQYGYAIQYWFFYAHNEGPLNTHEGDWEFITIFTDANGNPTRAAYSQHVAGETAPWSLVNTVGNHPKVYVALGSHASYFRPYQGKLGMANDEVSGSGRVLSPDDYTLEILTDQPWLQFAGHWGDYGSLDAGLRGERGPQGPMYIQERRPWNNPLSWESELTVLTSGMLNLNWFVYYLFAMIIGFMLIGLVIKIVFKFKLYKKQGTLGPRLFPFFYGGNTVRTVGMMLGLIAIILAVVGYFLPWYTVSLDIGSGPYATDGEIDVLVLNGIRGLQFNRLESGGGLVQIMGLPIAFGWILLFSTIIFFFGTLGLREAGKMGKKFIGRGIKSLVPVIIIMVFVVMLSGLVMAFAGETQDEIGALVSLISSRPMGGYATENLGDYGSADISWGLGSGAYMLIISAVLSFVSAVMVLSAGGNFYELGTTEIHDNYPYQPGQMDSQPPGYQPPPSPYIQPPVPSGTPPPPSPTTEVITCSVCGFSAAPPIGMIGSIRCPQCGSMVGQDETDHDW